MTFSPQLETCPLVERRGNSAPRPDDEPHLTELYRRHGSWLIAALRRKFGRETAEDLAQDVYVRLSSRPLEQDIRRPKAFLMTVASNLAIDAERKRRRQAPSEEPIVSFDDWTAGEESSQFEYMALKEAILTMPLPLRDTFLLSRFQGLTYQAIAQKLDISVKTVEWRMSRALEHCSERMRS